MSLPFFRSMLEGAGVPVKLAASALLAALVGAPAIAADIDVNVTVGHPSFYGRVDIGGAPPPVIYRQPVVIHRVVAPEPPVYLRVPPGHARNWRKHCDRYDACGRRVFFVRDDWYRNVYAPAHRPHRDAAPGAGDRRVDRHDGHGHGHGKKDKKHKHGKDKHH